MINCCQACLLAAARSRNILLRFGIACFLFSGSLQVAASAALSSADTVVGLVDEISSASQLQLLLSLLCLGE